MSMLKENMLLARGAIKYVDKLGLTSTNVPFRLGSYAKSPLSRFDGFMIYYLRSESNLAPSTVNPYIQRAVDKEKQAIGGKLHAKEAKKIRDDIVNDFRDIKKVRTQMLQIIHSHVGKGEKKRQLTALMNQINFHENPYDINWFGMRTKKPDEKRIRLARKAIKFKHGNCGEKAAIAATWLLEQTKNTKLVYYVCAQAWDHAWLFMADVGSGLSKATVLGEKFSGWPADAVVVDGWTSDWYPVHHPHDPIKGTPYNLFQLHVRNKIRQNQRGFHVMEECRWPPRFAPAFRLENAGKSSKEYVRSPGYAAMLDLVDDASSVEDGMEGNDEST